MYTVTVFRNKLCFVNVHWTTWETWLMADSVVKFFVLPKNGNCFVQWLTHKKLVCSSLYLNNFSCIYWPMIYTACSVIPENIKKNKTWKQWLLFHFTSTVGLFSSPEPKAQVSYCHSAPSVVRPSVRLSVNFHIFNFFSRTAWWILMKLGRDEVLMVPYKCCCFSARSAQGWIQGGAKIGHGGSPSSRIFFFRLEGYSNKPNG